MSCWPGGGLLAVPGLARLAEAGLSARNKFSENRVENSAYGNDATSCGKLLIEFEGLRIRSASFCSAVKPGPRLGRTAISTFSLCGLRKPRGSSARPQSTRLSRICLSRWRSSSTLRRKSRNGAKCRRHLSRRQYGRAGCSMKEKADLVEGWRKKAESDLIAVDATIEAGAFDAACFHAQQAATSSGR